MGKNRCVLPMRTAKIGYIILSVLLCLLGLGMLLRPELAAAPLGRVVGVFMVLFGAVKLVGYFSKDLYRLAFQYDLAFGMLLLALGIIALARPEMTLQFLAVVLGVTVLADGLFKLQIALDARAFGIRRWWSIFALALLSGGLGLLLILRPWEGTQALAMLLGLALLGMGALNLCVALSTVKIVRHQWPDGMDRDFGFDTERKD